MLAALPVAHSLREAPGVVADAPPRAGASAPFGNSRALFLGFIRSGISLARARLSRLALTARRLRRSLELTLAFFIRKPQ